VERIRVAARGREEVLLTAIDELTREVRSRLGESLESIEEADWPVVEVTTSSWEALRNMSLGQLRWNQGRYEDAAAMFELALDKDPSFVAARGSLGLVLIQFLNEPERGKEMLRQALRDAEGLPERELLLVRAVHRQFVDGDLEGALDEYRRITDLYPDLMQPYNNSGRILLALGRHDEAVEMFEKATVADPQNSIPLWNLSYIHTTIRRDPYSGEDVARRLVELGPEIASHHASLGWTLLCQERYEEAIAVLQKAVELDPQETYAVPNLAHALLRAGRPEEAVPVYRAFLDQVRAGTRSASFAIAVRNLAIAERAAGRTGEAMRLAREEIERSSQVGSVPPDDAPGLLLLAQVEILARDPTSADEHISLAVAREVTDPNAVLRLAEAYALSGRHDQALVYVADLVVAGYPDPFLLRVLPSLSPLWQDPEFEVLFDAIRSP
jgi:tetratricopeptide (TPR) repeat protein